MSFTADLQAQYAEQWQAMTHHTFIMDVAGGRIESARFNRWLAQDNLYVQGLINYVGLLIGRAPAGLTEPLGQAVCVLADELRLFTRMARAAGAELDSATMAPNCYHYLRFLDSVGHGESFAAGLTVYWALEKAYLDSWAVVKQEMREGAPWAEFVEQWTKPEFGEWVAFLGSRVDELGTQLSAGERAAIAELYYKVVQYEHLFWDIATGAPDWPL